MGPSGRAEPGVQRRTARAATGRGAAAAPTVVAKELGRGFIAIRLPDLRAVRELIAYDDQGRVVFHGKAKRNLVQGLGFTPVRSK